MTDNVNHPSHYTSDKSGVECIEITRHRNFNIGNAIKYLWRAGIKDADISAKHIEDLKKAIFYITREIENIEDDLEEQQVDFSSTEWIQNLFDELKDAQKLDDSIAAHPAGSKLAEFPYNGSGRYKIRIKEYDDWCNN